MKRITDFRVGELRIPAERFPLPPRVAEMLRLYSGLAARAGGSAMSRCSSFPSTGWPKLRRRCWRTSPATRNSPVCTKRQRRCPALLAIREEALQEWIRAETLHDVRVAWGGLGGRVTALPCTAKAEGASQSSRVGDVRRFREASFRPPPRPV